MVDLPTDLEFHVAVDNHDYFIGLVNEILPTLTRRIRPQATTETALSPTRFHLLSIHDFNCLFVLALVNPSFSNVMGNPST
jgi:hypothetical protein